MQSRAELYDLLGYQGYDERDQVWFRESSGEDG
jgi:hypothetical protein